MLTGPRVAPIRLLLLAAVLFTAAAQADVAVPELHERVTDLTSTMNSDQKQTLESKLAAFESQKGSQIAVLIIPTTQPETIEQYSIRVADRWKLGRKGVDDGALLLVAKDDHTVRIEVGYGLEGAIPDAIAKRVVDEMIVPRFRDGDFNGGIDAGVAQLIGLVNGEALPPPKRMRAQGRQDDSLVFLTILIGVVAGMAVRALTSRGPGGFVALLVSGLAGVLLIGGLGVIMWAFFAMFIVIGGGPGGSGWYSGGGGFRSGGLGGGGFGGGFGGFGGGGASGRW